MGPHKKDMEEEIEAAYLKSGNVIGWRLLGSPSHVLNGAEVAFIGLNPAGNSEPADHPRFAPIKGSAYVDECWGTALPGQHRLQHQVRTLFEILGVKPESVLAGNLIPFRSPSYKALENPGECLKFAVSLWSRIISRAKPKLLITMGFEVEKAITTLAEAKLEKHVALGWGNITGRGWTFADGQIIALPHLSRFSVITRAQSQSGLSALFGKRWKT